MDHTVNPLRGGFNHEDVIERLRTSLAGPSKVRCSGVSFSLGWVSEDLAQTPAVRVSLQGKHHHMGQGTLGLETAVIHIYIYVWVHIYIYEST